MALVRADKASSACHTQAAKEAAAAAEAAAIQAEEAVEAAASARGLAARSRAAIIGLRERLLERATLVQIPTASPVASDAVPSQLAAVAQAASSSHAASTKLRKLTHGPSASKLTHGPSAIAATPVSSTASRPSMRRSESAVSEHLAARLEKQNRKSRAA